MSFIGKVGWVGWALDSVEVVFGDVGFHPMVTLRNVRGSWVQICRIKNRPNTGTDRPKDGTYWYLATDVWSVSRDRPDVVGFRKKENPELSLVLK